MKKCQNINIAFYLNDKLIKSCIHPAQTALKLIRNELGLTGTKESCSEGDCGACTIALGTWQDKKFSYKAITSCILPAAKLHGKHVITIEGLEDNNKLHLIQQMILENNATQCGYCTPGVIMSLFCLLANNNKPSREEINAALEGNLCRCTGYVQISHAAQAIIKQLNKDPQKFKQLILPKYVKNIKQKIKNISKLTYAMCEKPNIETTESYHTPTSLDELFKLINKFKKQGKIINGGTDIIVAANIHKIHQQHLIDITKIAILNNIHEKKNTIIIGGAVTLDQLMNNKLIIKKLPILNKTISHMSSTQIRNIATLAGNIANASPIADAACTLLALNAKLTLQSKTGKRKITLTEFYQKYKQTALKPTEIISQIEIPITKTKCSFEKTSKRKAVDIATVNSMINIEIKNNKVADCCIAFGGVAPYPTLAKQCAKFLIGKKITQDVINTAAEIVIKEFTPISDVRGSKKYRTSLIRNHIIKHLYQYIQDK